jgi:hypothetical protein
MFHARHLSSSSLGGVKKKKFCLLVAMATRVLHRITFFEQLQFIIGDHWNIPVKFE